MAKLYCKSFQWFLAREISHWMALKRRKREVREKENVIKTMNSQMHVAAASIVLNVKTLDVNRGFKNLKVTNFDALIS